MDPFQPWRLLSAIVLFLAIPVTHGWGEEGHYAVCKIAENYLTEEAAAAVKALLPDSAEGDLANVCSWPDEIRHQYGWSSALHFADTPDFSCYYEYCRDCHDTKGLKDRCVTGAIHNYTKQLVQESYDSDSSKLKYNLTEAIMFLSHFYGDIHQPLHIGFLGDLGGNTIPVNWYEAKTNLHRVWDDMIIGSALKTIYDNNVTIMIQSIQRNIADDFINASSRENCSRTVCPDPYASESISLACSYAYTNVTPGTTLGDDYFYSRLPVVETRLAQGGVRLAALLNKIFSKSKSIATE